MGVAYLEINKLPFLHEFDIPKCINVYLIYRTKLGVIGFFAFSFLICFQMYETLLYFFLILHVGYRKNKKKISIEPILANPRNARADPGFQVMRGALKKIALSGRRCENFWGISCEKSRFYTKKSYYFPPWIRPWIVLCSVVYRRCITRTLV